MKDLLNKAKELGFTPLTLSTAWTYKGLLGENPKFGEALINDTCKSLLLSEIQKWLRENFDLDCEVHNCIFNGKSMYFSEVILGELYSFFEEVDRTNEDFFLTYEGALQDSIDSAINLIIELNGDKSRPSNPNN